MGCIAALKLWLHIVDCTRTYLCYFMIYEDIKNAMVSETEKTLCRHKCKAMQCKWNRCQLLLEIFTKIPVLKSEMLCGMLTHTVNVPHLKDLPNFFIVSYEISIVIFSVRLNLHTENYGIPNRIYSLQFPLDYYTILIMRHNFWSQFSSKFL